MAEWSIAAVLKTVEGNTSGGSNPSLSANLKRMMQSRDSGIFHFGAAASPRTKDASEQAKQNEKAGT